MAYRGEFEPHERVCIRQTGSIEIDVMDSAGNDGGDDGNGEGRYTHEQVDNSKSPAQLYEAAVTDRPSCCPY